MKRINLLLSFVSGILVTLIFISSVSNLASAKYTLNRTGIKTSFGLFQPIRLATEQQVNDVSTKATPAVVSINILKDVPLFRFFDDRSLNFWFNVPSGQAAVQKQKIGAGSGFMISSDGYILTNKHVVADTSADYTVTLSDGTEIPANVVYKDPDYDLALIKIAGRNYPFLHFADSSNLKIGQAVVGIGNALGEFPNTVASGMVSGLNRSITAFSTDQSENLAGLIQTNAQMYPGDSGSPLLDLNGNVIGVNVAVAEGTNISFAIPSNIAKQVINLVGIKA